MKILILILLIILTGCVGASRPEPINSYHVKCMDRGGLREVTSGVIHCNDDKELPRFR